MNENNNEQKNVVYEVKKEGNSSFKLFKILTAIKDMKLITSQFWNWFSKKCVHPFC